ncbi:hypothetical protein LCGC14_2924200 [marine sediment metagenome]|uniref:Uncharacterized protein n=1 Tax=marine sediment metagenome TaxID=412755 RepID=A0A0F8XN90_9ZZZZ
MFLRVYIFIDAVQAVYDHAVGVIFGGVETVGAVASELAITVGNSVAELARDAVRTAELFLDGVFKIVRG